ncbi:hypothetical protein BZA05DRAFT_199482 [Tricharina praecox]|uniref:uncharacterized protein n=1 Tax=Tricharina praecox TaxID=43433 RepID=UPI00221EF7DD|nr:uncharacterized protein BZA05DRAFT_199482 [Tricharina praecox]KAI5856377.1 hypothetical protein BZA05DRAFT_199482 [Tricharina praecox]
MPLQSHDTSLISYHYHPPRFCTPNPAPFYYPPLRISLTLYNSHTRSCTVLLPFSTPLYLFSCHHDPFITFLHHPSTSRQLPMDQDPAYILVCYHHYQTHLDNPDPVPLDCPDSTYFLQPTLPESMATTVALAHKRPSGHPSASSNRKTTTPYSTNPALEAVTD